ncbi:MAG: tyrosine-type recombinase/integrase [Kiloniellales bacterium]
MARLGLTDISVRAVKPPATGQVTYWDKALPSFGLRVSQGGTKSFVVMYGATRQLTTIGRYPVLKLSDARKEAKRLLAEHTLGRRRPQNITFDEAKRRYLAASALKNKPRTTYDYTRLLNRHFKLGRTMMGDITQYDIMRRVQKLSKTPAEQNYAFAAIKIFFRWAKRNNYIDHNPLADLPMPAAKKSRDRVLAPVELAEVYRKALAYGYPFGPIVALLVLTGQRRGEIGGLKWSWIDRQAQTITLPAGFAKNKREHTFPYGDLAAKIIDDLPVFVDGPPERQDYLFPAACAHVRGKPTGSYNGWTKTKPLFDATLEDVAPSALPDLRRTFSSSLAALGTPIHVTEKLLNHVSGTVSGVAAIYNRHTYMDEMRKAITDYEETLATLVDS